MTNIIMIGLPGSGKSTVAQALFGQTHQIISYDGIREKLWGDEATQGPWLEIQWEVHKQVYQALEIGRPICLDATNVVALHRQNFINGVELCAGEKLDWGAVLVNTPIRLCLERNAARSRTVPPEVILRMYKTLIHDFPRSKGDLPLIKVIQ